MQFTELNLVFLKFLNLLKVVLLLVLVLTPILYNPKQINCFSFLFVKGFAEAIAEEVSNETGYKFTTAPNKFEAL